MKLKKTSLAALFPVLAMTLAGCGAGVASPGEPGAPDVAMPMPVEVTLPRKAAIFATYHTTTTIASDADAPVPARVDGEVVAILVEEGDRVTAGQVLARLDGERLRLEMHKAKADLEKTRREYERFISLQQRGLVSKAALEDMKFDLDALQAGYELQRLNFSYTNIRAPISGVVSARDIKIGQHINSGAATFRITDTTRLVAYLRIPQSELSKFEAGHVAEVRVDAMPEQVFKATIARISPTIDARNGTFRATAYIDNEAVGLAPGMFGRFDIAYEEHADALVIPRAALVEEDSQTVVYVVNDGAAVRRPIETGIEENGLVEVLSGLGENELIVITGHGSLRDGSRVLAGIPTGVSVTG